MTRLAASVLERTTGARAELTLLLALAGFVGYIFHTSMQYSADTRLFPLVLSLITGPLLVGVSIRFLRESNLSVPETTSVDERERQKAIAKAIGAVVGSVGALLVAGYAVGGFVFLALYYRIYTAMTWRYVVGYATTITVLVYVLFELVLGVRLYLGVVEFL